MKNEQMIKRPRNFLMAMITAAGVFFSVIALPETGFSRVPAVQNPTDYPANVDPYEVIVYEHANFVGSYLRFKLEPGMRQRLVPVIPESMNDKISSIQVGSKVGVILFIDANFGHGGGDTLLFQSAKVLDQSVFNSFSDLNDSISSLIVFPNEWRGGPIGVMLSDKHMFSHYWRFYPLPESLSQTEARFTHLPDMDDDANAVQFYPWLKTTQYSNLQLTLYESPDFQGRWITLPGADGSFPPGGYFSFNDYQFDDTASSLIVRWTGPQPPRQVQSSNAAPPPSTSTHVTAPDAPDSIAQNPSDRKLPPPGSEANKVPSHKAQTAFYPAVTYNDISGQWNSNIGAVYQIQQSGNQFTWSAPSLNQSGTGAISGKSITLSGPGWTVKGQVTETDASGNPTRIVGENGVILFRKAGGTSVPAQQPASSTPTALPGGIISLAGQWKSSIGRVYDITQQGSQIAWTVVDSDEKGQGTITSSDLSASWKGLMGSGSSSGQITVDSSGKAFEIKWNNGVRFFR